ncbi:hypothetical protein DFP85_105112 [Halomonas ventosae]|uniref:Uncharacterized protein n=1 Tax=Halomonas ventosae TaxID=229007 RepID=A0A4R6ZTK6_9GAMM|nr:hypothetical protein [Halomonas ventosae]TDR55938.1 hypothetical protein DFP85_105112 [Halomonas ventosae]
MKVSSVSSVRSAQPRPLQSLIAITFSLVLLTLGTSQSQAEERNFPQAEGFAAMEGMDLAEMDQARAREGEAIVNLTTVKSVQNLKASVTDTSFDIGGDMVSGNISFAPDALGSYSGTGIFSAVTGNGNSINNAVGISVFIAN